MATIGANGTLIGLTGAFDLSALGPNGRTKQSGALERTTNASSQHGSPAKFVDEKKRTTVFFDVVYPPHRPFF
jgi:hypothetical protein